MWQWLPSQLPIVASLALLLSTAGCVQLERQGGPCSDDGDCAAGLACREMRCRSVADKPAPALNAVMRDLRRAAQKQAPRVQDEAPEALLDVARTVGSKIRVDIYTSRHLPDHVPLPGGSSYQATASAERLTKRIGTLAQKIPGLRLDKHQGLSEEQAVQEQLQILRTDSGIPVFVGAVVRTDERREAVPVVSGPESVDYALATSLWRLHAKKQGNLHVGFVCTAGAFCPRVDPKPQPPGGGDWDSDRIKALNEVYAPFDEIRLELMTELQEAGIQPLAIIAHQPIPEHVHVLALMVPTQPLDTETLAWLNEVREGGASVLLLLPGARMVSSGGTLAAIVGGHAGLLTSLGLRRDHALLADRASLAKFKAPDRNGGTGDLLPLVTEVSRTDPFHGSVTGLYGLNLPFGSSFQAVVDGPVPIAWSRPGVSPVTLPATASNAGMDSAAPPQPRGQERVLAMAIDEAGKGRAVVVGSSLACVSMSATELLKTFDVKAQAPQKDEFVRRLASFAAGARAYRSTHRGNRALRGSTLQFLKRAAYWLAEPEGVRGLSPR